MVLYSLFLQIQSKEESLFKPHLKEAKDLLSAYATETQAGDVPLKPVGCQVIEETQSAQPHRRRSQSASLADSREESSREREKQRNRERDPIIRGHGGKWGHGSVTEWGTGSRAGGRVPLTALCSCSLALCGS